MNQNKSAARPTNGRRTYQRGRPRTTTIRCALVASLLAVTILSGCVGDDEKEQEKREKDLYPPDTDDWRKYMLDDEEIPSELLPCPDAERDFGSNPYLYDELDTGDHLTYFHDVGLELYMLDGEETCIDMGPDDWEEPHWHVEGQITLDVSLTAEQWEDTVNDPIITAHCESDIHQGSVLLNEPRLLHASTVGGSRHYDEQPEEMIEKEHEIVKLLVAAVNEKHPDWEDPCASD